MPVPADPAFKQPCRVLVFDSGIGGLTIASELLEAAAGLQIDYAADTGFFPYGDKSDAALRERVVRVAVTLVSAAQPDVFVIACNTASTLALNEVRAALDIPVVGTVPAIKPAAQQTRTGVIGLLATPGTLAREYTARLIHDFASNCRVLQHGSVELVRLAEAYAAGEALEPGAVGRAVQPLFDQPGGAQIDHVVLACTHFPLLREALLAAAPHPVALIDSGNAIARQTLRVLGARTGGGDSHLAKAYVTSPDPGRQIVQVFERYGFSAITRVSVDAATPG